MTGRLKGKGKKIPGAREARYFHPRVRSLAQIPFPFPRKVNDKSTDWEQKFLSTNLFRAFQPKVALAFKKCVCLPRGLKYIIMENFRVTCAAICTTWPSFTFSCHLLFITSAQISVVSRQFCQKELFYAVFICSLSFWRNSQLDSDVCRLP